MKHALLLVVKINVNLLSANPRKWQKPTNCLSLFDHFVGLALKRLLCFSNPPPLLISILDRFLFVISTLFAWVVEAYGTCYYWIDTWQNNFQENVFNISWEKWFSFETYVILDAGSYLSYVLVSVTTQESIIINFMSDLTTKSSSFDPENHLTAA